MTTRIPSIGAWFMAKAKKETETAKKSSAASAAKKASAPAAKKAAGPEKHVARPSGGPARAPAHPARCVFPHTSPINPRAPIKHAKQKSPRPPNPPPPPPLLTAPPPPSSTINPSIPHSAERTGDHQFLG